MGGIHGSERGWPISSNSAEKKNGPLCVSCHVLMCRFLSALCFTVFACEFLNTAFSLRMRFELPFYGTFANYLRWVVCCLSLLLLWRCCYFGGFYVKGNNGF